MAGFRKAQAEQAAVKMGIYGPPGAGKTLTSLLIAEGLAKASGKRVAYVDTERGTDFYCQAVPTRGVHPEAFDFDALYTRSLTEVSKALQELKPDEYGVIVLDSITHLWEAAIAAYGGNKATNGAIPMHAWGRIKKPYKDLMAFLLSSPMHVIICGRQGVEYSKEDDDGESKAVGVKMKAEGETPYEPHILIRMEAVKPLRGKGVAKIVAYAEKDRTGILSGKSFDNPTFATLIAPIMGLLGGVQAHVPTDDETAAQDAEALQQAEREKAAKSAEYLRTFSAKFDLAATVVDVEKVGKEITAAVKKQMSADHVAALRQKWSDSLAAIKAQTTENNRLDAEIAAGDRVQ